MTACRNPRSKASCAGLRSMRRFQCEDKRRRDKAVPESFCLPYPSGHFFVFCFSSSSFSSFFCFCSFVFSGGVRIAQLVERPAEKPGAILTRVRVLGAAREFSHRVNFKCRLS